MDILGNIALFAFLVLLVSANAGADDDGKIGCIAGSVFIFAGCSMFLVGLIQFIHNLF